MWKSFENIGLQTSEKVSWEKRRQKHAQNIRSTVHRTGDLIMPVAVSRSEGGGGAFQLRLPAETQVEWTE